MSKAAGIPYCFYRFNTFIVANSKESIGLEATTNLDTSTPRDMLHTAAPIVVINDVSVLKVSSEEMGYQLAEKEIKKLDEWEENLHTPVPVANVTVMKDKTPDKFVPTRQQISEMKSFNPNILPMVVSDNATVESDRVMGSWNQHQREVHLQN